MFNQMGFCAIIPFFFFLIEVTSYKIAIISITIEFYANDRLTH